MTKYDVIIIGSGLGGLECGYILARNGKKVLILEQGSQPGGCMQSYRRRGQLFDTGFHYVGGLGEGQSLHAAFKYLDLLDLPWHQLDKDGFDRVSFVDASNQGQSLGMDSSQTYSLPQGFEHFVEGLSAQFPSEREALQQYVSLLRKANDEQLAAISPDAHPSDEMDSQMSTGAWQYLQDTFHDATLRNVLSGNSLKMELRRDTLPLFSFLHGNSSFVESSWRLKGDGSLLVNRLVEGIKKQGGEIICQARVEELVEKEGKLVEAVVAHGHHPQLALQGDASLEHYEADCFISDIHPALTCDLVKESTKMKRIYRRRIHNVENTFGMFTVSLTYAPDTLEYFNYNQYIYRQKDVWQVHEHPELGGVLVSCRVPEDGSRFARQVDLLTPMPLDSCDAWKDTCIGHRGEDYEAMKERMADECIALADQLIPGIAKYEHRYTSSPLTWRDYTFTPQGSAYGMRKDYHFPLQTILSPRTPIPNLLLTGQNLILHGIHGVTMTTLYTCAEVLGRDKIWNIVKEE